MTDGEGRSADAMMPATWVGRYLALIGAEREPPSRAALTRLMRAQGSTAVFENVTAILRRARTGDGPVPAVDLDLLLQAREARRGGGVCFEHTPMFRQLLASLGYRVQAILAQISFPGSHHATLVDLDRSERARDAEGGRYLVDIGGGSPLWQPVRLGETVEIRHAGLHYRLRPAEPEDLLNAADLTESADEASDQAVGERWYVQERWIDGAWTLFCRYDLRPASDNAIEGAYQRHQLAGETWVVGNLTLVRCTEDAVYRLRDDELVTHTAAQKHAERLTTDADYQRVAADVFGVPGLPIQEARAALARIHSRR